MQAKHDAAYKMMLQIRKTAQAGGNLNKVTNEKLLTCSEWFV
jgi:RISC-loading complex subunit TARBP2